MTTVTNSYNNNININNSKFHTDMAHVLHDIRNTFLRCDNCKKIIMKTIYRLRRTNMKCCSSKCADEYGKEC